MNHELLFLPSSAICADPHAAPLPFWFKLVLAGAASAMAALATMVG